MTLQRAAPERWDRVVVWQANSQPAQRATLSPPQKGPARRTWAVRARCDAFPQHWRITCWLIDSLRLAACRALLAELPR